MRARTVSFYIDPELLPECKHVLDAELFPRYLEMSHFVGLVVLESDVGGRPEVVGLSVWDGDLEDSDAIIEEFLRRLYAVAGITATQKSYQVTRLVSRQDL